MRLTTCLAVVLLGTAAGSARAEPLPVEAYAERPAMAQPSLLPDSTS
ncbi:MAG TPA: hypothetical protein VEB20_18160 [Azospirillaceae bacterium]|nr:hypothetical protein [Azospirillaceae bacterium]